MIILTVSNDPLFYFLVYTPAFSTHHPETVALYDSLWLHLVGTVYFEERDCIALEEVEINF